ncbi:MAG: hypothetical protein JSV72_00785 [Ralstonia sp.]|jgi:hypothetical protein|nr:MAG: hypothetical protein JSV72_00785 [Ralstonia sp.]
MSEADLIERLAEAIGKRIKPALPLDVQLWNLEMIGAYLQRSTRVVGERIVTLPGFPKAIRLPAARAKTAGEEDDGKGKAQPLWKASEVIAWTEGHRDKVIGRPRKTD